MKNIKTMKAFGAAVFIFGCIIVIISLSVYFLSDDKSETESVAAQHIVYQSIGELGGFATGDKKSNNSIVKTISVVSDNIDNPEIETIINCYTTTSATIFRDHLRAINSSLGQLCVVQKNLKETSNFDKQNIDRCTKPNSIILSINELKKLGRNYTGDFDTDLAQCKI